MDESAVQPYKFTPSFYDEYLHDDENIQAKIKPILNQILESRVTVKELHIQYGVKFSEIINSYQNRLEDLKSGYDILISELRQKHSEILHLSAKLLDQYSK